VVLGALPGAEAPVAGLPLAVRAVLSLSEAGFEEVALLAPGRPARLARPLGARRIAVRWCESAADADGLAARPAGDVLVLAGNVLVNAEALAGLRSAPRGPVVTRTGETLGRVVAAGEVRGAVEGLQAPLGDGALSDPSLPGSRLQQGLAVPLAAASARALEERLLDALSRRTQAGDSYLAALIDRRLSRPVTRLLLRVPVAPSQVTLLSVAAGLAGAAGLATVAYPWRVAGVLLLVLSVVLDCVDGELARARHQQSAAGARLDVVGDYLVHLAVFAGLATGLLRQGLGAGGAWAALALVAGVGAAMLTVHVLFIRPALRKGGDLHWEGSGESLRGTPVGTVAEKLASRDYTYLLLVLAVAGRLEWFLYAAAAGSWAFAAGLIAYRLLAVPAHRGEVASS
jgi:phosphatidylglycerophosphate synthase